MTLKIHELVGVASYFSEKRKMFCPVRVSWRNKDYKITKLGLHHTYIKGEVLHHVFSVTSENLFLCLDFNTKNLNWYLMEVVNGF